LRFGVWARVRVVLKTRRWLPAIVGEGLSAPLGGAPYVWACLGGVR